ncbi:ATP-binding protein [Streptomyces sp. NPDC048389]|uniref:ATP-binding protein n=1 Tax=Streptomyces sp. NPDC048389 TaxID=3154622 RepID=UPI00345508D5
MDVNACRSEVRRKKWELPFLAEARELAALRRIMGLHLRQWGLPHLTDAARICVTEMVSNVIRHVGDMTPTTLAVSMNGTYLRIDVQDPDARALPTLLSAHADDEVGRGMALIDATADRWGVILRADSKVTWCELATGLTAPDGHVGDPGVTRAEALIGLYSSVRHRHRHRHAEPDASRLSVATAQESAIDVITDLLLWLRAHGCDPDEALDRAQLHFEEEAAC